MEIFILKLVIVILFVYIAIVHIGNNLRFIKIVEGLDLLREIDEQGHKENRDDIVKLADIVEKEISIRQRK